MKIVTSESIKNQLMTEQEAGDYLNWSIKTLQARRHKCQPPRYRKIGRSVRYTLADLEAFVESCAIEPQVQEVACSRK